MTSSSETEPRRYLITSKNPTLISGVAQTIAAHPQMELVEALGPAAEPHTLVVKITSEQAAALEQRYQGQINIEPDQPLSLFAKRRSQSARTPTGAADGPARRTNAASAAELAANTGGTTMPDNSELQDPSSSARLPGRPVGNRKAQFVVASRRYEGVQPLAFSPLAFNAVENALRSSPDIEVVDTIGPKGFGALADGLSGPPNVIVARMTDDKAAQLRAQGAGQLIVEPDHPLVLHDPVLADAAVMSQPALLMGTIAGARPLTASVIVLGVNNAPIKDAEVYLFGSLLPASGVTDAQGQVTLSLIGDTPQSIRGLYVKPKSDYWNFYQQQPDIDTAQPNVVFLRPLSDTFANFPQKQVFGWGQKAMRLDQVPSTLRGQGVKVAIVDSGAAVTHVDLQDIRTGIDIINKRTTPQTWNQDTIAHGSHCAGVIAGADVGIGVRGFAPAAEVHVCKVFPGGQVSQLIEALEYCIEQQIDVVNLSLGSNDFSEALEQQIVRAKRVGVACIVAAGNTGGAVQYPATSPNVLAVAAIGKLREFPGDSYHSQSVGMPIEQGSGYFSAKFTCFGPEIGVCAPGVAIVSSVPTNNYAAWDGTSMAAPHVTGLAALVLAHHPDFKGHFSARNSDRVDRLFQILKLSARPINLGDPRRTGAGMPDALVALGLQPMAGQAQLNQFAPHALFGNLLGQVGQPLGGVFGGQYGNQGLGSQVGGAVGSLGRLLPFNVDPITAQYAQQAQIGQFAPQGFFGNFLGQGQPFGGSIVGLFGNRGLGSPIAAGVGQLAGYSPPFNIDPATAAYVSQWQQAQLGNPFVGPRLGV